MPLKLVEPRFFLESANEEDAATNVPQSNSWSRAIEITSEKSGSIFNVSTESTFIGSVNELKHIAGITLVKNQVY
jgi:hypothetical protein